jgi:hypothetical protein
MNRLVFVLSVLLGFLSCSKNDPQGPENASGLLKEINTTIAGRPEVTTQLFEYDGQERLIRVRERAGSAAEKVLYEISYPDPSRVRGCHSHAIYVHI